MNAVMVAESRPVTEKDTTRVVKLSERDLQRGAEVLGSLSTVQRYLKLNDTCDSLTVEQIAKSVVENDKYDSNFIAYIRRVAHYEYLDWKKVIMEILFVRRDYFDEIARREFGKPVLWVREELPRSD